MIISVLELYTWYDFKIVKINENESLITFSPSFRHYFFFKYENVFFLQNNNVYLFQCLSLKTMWVFFGKQTNKHSNKSSKHLEPRRNLFINIFSSQACVQTEVTLWIDFVMCSQKRFTARFSILNRIIFIPKTYLNI